MVSTIRSAALTDLKYNASMVLLASPGGTGPKLKLDSDRSTLILSNIRHKDLIGKCQDYDHLSNMKEIFLNDFDAILLSGVGNRTLRRIYSENRVEYSHGISGIPGIECMPGVPQISRNLYNSILRQWYSSQESVSNIRKIRSVYSGKLLIQQYPLPTKDFLFSIDNPSHFKGTTNTLMSYIFKYAKRYIDEEFSDCQVIRTGDMPAWIQAGISDCKSKDFWHPNVGKMILKEILDLLG